MFSLIAKQLLLRNYLMFLIVICTSNTYIVEVQRYCLGGTCLKQNGFQALVDSGSSFTYLPSEIFTKVVTEVQVSFFSCPCFLFPLLVSQVTILLSFRTRNQFFVVPELFPVSFLLV